MKSTNIPSQAWWGWAYAKQVHIIQFFIIQFFYQVREFCSNNYVISMAILFSNGALSFDYMVYSWFDQ